MTRSRMLIIGAVAVAAIVAFLVTRKGEVEQPLLIAAATAADAEFDTCLECHDNLDASIEAGLVPLIGFSHQMHFSTSGDVGCGNCHGLDTHDRTPPLAPTMDQCLSCHRADGVAPQLPCLHCHEATTVAPPQSHFTSDWSELHGSGAILSQSLCETCHSKESFCTACHGVEIPHVADWASELHPAAAAAAGIESCARCHERGPELMARDDCDACHHPQNIEVPRWRDAHPQVVLENGGTACFECHDPDTCVTCHTTGREDFGRDFSRLRTPADDSGTDE